MTWSAGLNTPMVFGLHVMGVLLAVHLVWLLDGPWTGKPVAWTAETLSSSTLTIPLESRPAEAMSLQVGTVLLSAYVSAGLLGLSQLILGTHLPLNTLAILPMGGITYLLFHRVLPWLLRGRQLASLPRPGTKVRLEGRILHQGKRRFHFGRADAKHLHQGALLTLQNNEERMLLRGCPTHLEALKHRLDGLQLDVGSRSDVPEVLRSNAPTKAVLTKTNSDRGA